ncbi:unknown similar to AdorNPV orf110 [Mythimna separata entomopoxvirus 'L']|uniref:Uncharacterized protein n=1 Tax=Mythimna separata entomopoxvirus 'L' TaxID=1293572 RepID=A0A916NYG0_9POXV|nr:unknown similar to AdorNPV orf110 [Mythimna separata entomopoxvirus 'L']CCU56348.1 unknown similar to AdorNPV orf110 [Mythimna separata entomopoxvirus 'L']
MRFYYKYIIKMIKYILFIYLLYITDTVKSIDNDPGYSYRFDITNIIKRPNFLDRNFNNNINGIYLSRHHIISHDILHIFYYSMTRNKKYQQSLIKILKKIKEINKNKFNIDDIDNLIKCLNDEKINIYNEINICTELLKNVYVFIYDMPFNIFIGPSSSNRYFDLGSNIDVEGRALLPDNLILTITDAYYTMLAINENKNISDEELNKLVDNLCVLLDYDLKSIEFDKKLWILVDNIKNKNKNKYDKILKNPDNFKTLKNKLYNAKKQEMSVNEFRKIQNELQIIFNMVFDLVSDNPDLITDYADNLLRDPMSLNMGEFIQNILTSDPNSFTSLPIEETDSNSNKTVYKLSFDKINKAYKILMCYNINNIKNKLKTISKLDIKSTKNLNQFISIIESLIDDCIPIDYYENLLTTTVSNYNNDNNDDDDNNDNNKRMQNFIKILNNITNDNPNIIIDNAINSIVYIMNILLPLIRQSNSNQCMISHLSMRNKIIKRHKRNSVNFIVSNMDTKNSLYVNKYYEIIGVYVQDISSYLYYNYNINKWKWTTNYSLFSNNILNNYNNKIPYLIRIRRNLIDICQNKKK